VDERWFLDRADLAALVALLRRDHRVLAPQARDGALVLDDLASVADLPWGVHDEQSPGRYRLHPAEPDGAEPDGAVPDEGRCFDQAVGPQGLKALTFAPHEVLWRSRRADDGSLTFAAAPLPAGSAPAPALAVLGARACDLTALQQLDQHFLYREHVEEAYARRRRALFLVAVDCARPAGTCFCAATGDGPTARSGFDVALTELDAGFVVRALSEAGFALLDALPVRVATAAEQDAATAQGRAAADAQHRGLPPLAPGALLDRRDDARWAAVADRCLSCGNCTAVCPTCFCHAQTDEPVADDPACVEHCREWDSCFGEAHSYVHGLLVRGPTRLRYRQWATHKLDTWFEQFGRSGCVGCGRCLTWCPAGIDLTAEVAALLGPVPPDRREPPGAGPEVARAVP